jgi:hypothetical protein
MVGRPVKPNRPFSFLTALCCMQYALMELTAGGGLDVRHLRHPHQSGTQLTSPLWTHHCILVLCKTCDFFEASGLFAIYVKTLFMTK